MTAFVAASFQNVSAALRLHSLSETMYFASLSFFRLICSFHNFFRPLSVVLRFFIIIKFLWFVNLLSVNSHRQHQIQEIISVNGLDDARRDGGIEENIDKIVLNDTQKFRYVFGIERDGQIFSFHIHVDGLVHVPDFAFRQHVHQLFLDVEFHDGNPVAPR